MAWSLEQVIRGGQLAWLGSVLAFQNHNLYKHRYVKVFGYLAGVSIILYIITSTLLLIPLKILQLLVYLFSLIFRYDHHLLSDNYNLWITNYVLNFPFLGLLLVRYIYPQILDSVFIDSLRHVDYVYLQKHKGEKELRPPYASALERYGYGFSWSEIYLYLKRTGNQIKIAVLLYFISLMPLIGALVYPAANAYALVRSLGYKPAITVGVLMYITPGTKSFAMIFLETLLSSRALMRELLEPYFGRINFEEKEKRKWFREREGILFGFSIGFYLLVRLPLVGMLFYGVAQAAAALVLVKTTDPPPPPNLLSTYKIDYHYRDPRKKKHKQ